MLSRCFSKSKVIGWGWFYLPTRWKWRSTHQASIMQTSFTNRTSYLTIVQVTLLVNLLTGWMIMAWIMCVGRHTILRRKARLNAGIRRSRIASCWRTNTCQAILKHNSMSSLATTIISITMKAWKTSHLPMLHWTWGEHFTEKRKNQTTNIRNATLATSQGCSLK